MHGCRSNQSTGQRQRKSMDMYASRKLGGGGSSFTVTLTCSSGRLCCRRASALRMLACMGACKSNRRRPAWHCRFGRLGAEQNATIASNPS